MERLFLNSAIGLQPILHLRIPDNPRRPDHPLSRPEQQLPPHDRPRQLLCNFSPLVHAGRRLFPLPRHSNRPAMPVQLVRRLRVQIGGEREWWVEFGGGDEGVGVCCGCGCRCGYLCCYVVVLTVAGVVGYKVWIRC